MMLLKISKLYFFILALVPTLYFASGDSHEQNHVSQDPKDIKTHIKEFINHHIQDSYYFDIIADEKEEKHYGFGLPIILWDNGLKMFSASRFEHEKAIASVEGNFYRLHHNKIYKSDAEGNILIKKITVTEKDKFGKEITKEKEVEIKPLNFSITKNVVAILITVLLMLWIFGSMAKNYKKTLVPIGLGKIFEPIILYVRDEIARPNIGEKKYKRYLPFLLTVFFFVWFANLLGLTPLGINLTGNIAITFTLALFTFLLTNFTGTKTYWKHLLDPLGDTMPWIAKIPIYILLVPIELLGIIIKPFSLMLRLYANMTAGHVVVMSIIGFIYIFNNIGGGVFAFCLSFFIMIIEFFVALLQAYIFTMLSSMYFGFAAEEHHEHEHAH